MNLFNKIGILSSVVAFTFSVATLSQDDIFDIDDNALEETKIDGFLKLHRILDIKEEVSNFVN